MEVEILDKVGGKSVVNQLCIISIKSNCQLEQSSNHVQAQLYRAAISNYH